MAALGFLEALVFLMLRVAKADLTPSDCRIKLMPARPAIAASRND